VLTLALATGAAVRVVADGGARIEGDLHVTGAITADGDVKAGDISLTSHRHSGFGGHGHDGGAMTFTGMDRYTGKMAGDIDHIAQSVTTFWAAGLFPPCMRIMARWLLTLADMPNNPATRLLRASASAIAIARWEPRNQVAPRCVGQRRCGRAIGLYAGICAGQAAAPTAPLNA
jgi:phage baseplate assembly protein W